MATLKQIAEGCGVSKPFIRKLVRELDPEESHVQTVGNRIELDAWLSSQVSAEALRRKPPSPAEDGAKAIIEADAEARDMAELHHRELHHREVLQLKDEQIGILKEERDRLRSQVDALMQQNANLQKLLSEAQKSADAAQATVAKMAGASVWQRLTGFKGLLGPGQ